MDLLHDSSSDEDDENDLMEIDNVNRELPKLSG